MPIIFIKSVRKFLDQLNPILYAKVSRHITLLKSSGKGLGMPFSKRMDKNLYELRILGVINVRIFYTFQDNQIILLHAFIKTTHKTPLKHTRTAKQRLQTLT